MAKSNFLFFQRLLFGLGILYLTVTVFFFLLFGPVTLNFGGFRLSFTSLVNPIRISLGLFLFSFIFKILGDIKGKFTLASVSQEWWGLMKSGGNAEDSPNPEKTQPRHHLWAEVLLLIMIFWGTFFFIRHYTADVAGFADTYGYVSEAVRLSQGHFYEPERIYSRFGLPEKASRSHPLGYAPKGKLGTVPAYPFGYPLIMAAFIRIFGLQGAYWVTPLLASGTVILCYLLGRVYFGRLGGLLTAGLIFFFPNFLHSAFFPMSDVPATFFSALSLVALLTLPMGPLADFILGASLGFGFWVRPNILLLVFPIVLWIMIRREWPRLIRSLLVLALFLLINILVNIHLFGSPQPYGHGTPPLGDTLSNAVERGLRHLFRLHDQQAEIGILLVTLGLLFGRLSRNLRVFLGGIFIIFLIFFACYRWEDAWWYFRFLLPAFPAIALLETSFLVQLMAAVAWKRSGNFFLVVFFSVFTLASIQFSRDQFVFTNPHSEIKHPLAAEMALRHVKQPALIYAMLYSGSLRFYGKLATSRYDLGSPAGMLKEIRDIQKAGGRVYLLLDHGELKKMIETENRMLLNYSRLIDSLDHPEQIELYELNVPLMKDNLL